MPQPPAQPLPEPIVPLRPELYDEVARTLRNILPLPVVDTQEDPEASLAQVLDQRIRAAIAVVASLRPADVNEASLAIHYVAATAQAEHLMGLVAEHAGSPLAAKLEVQVRGLTRLARDTVSQLRRMQAARRKRDKDPVTRRQDAWARQILRQQLTEAWGRMSREPVAGPPPPVPEQVVAPPQAAGTSPRPALKLVASNPSIRPSRLKTAPSLTRVPPT